MKTPEEVAKNTAAYVRCHGGLVEGDPGCGLQPLTAEQYAAQLSYPYKSWRCPACGNSADYDDTQSERVQGVYDDGQTSSTPPAERDRILEAFAAALDSPAPDALFDRLRAVDAAARKDIEALVFTNLLRAALFSDDVQVAHPELDTAAIMRIAADCLLRAAVVCVSAAKKLEGTDFDPARFAIVVFAHSEQWLAMSRKEEHALFSDYVPGALRAELEAEGFLPKRNSETVGAEISSNTGDING